MNTHEDNETIKILYNVYYGGWEPSNKALNLYKARMIEIDPNFTGNVYIHSIKRHDPVLVQVYYDLGDEFDDNHSKTNIAIIPKKYENYYEISEYDGLESIQIHENKYELDEIKKDISHILSSNIDNDEKISKFNNMKLKFNIE